MFNSPYDFQLNKFSTHMMTRTRFKFATTCPNYFKSVAFAVVFMFACTKQVKFPFT